MFVDAGESVVAVLKRSTGFELRVLIAYCGVVVSSADDDAAVVVINVGVVIVGRMISSPVVNGVVNTKLGVTRGGKRFPLANSGGRRGGGGKLEIVF